MGSYTDGAAAVRRVKTLGTVAFLTAFPLADSVTGVLT
jgi:hypothetical protein